MASVEEVLGRKINSIKELKKYINDLQNSLLGLDSESQEFKNTVQQLSTAQDYYSRITKATSVENTAAKDSVVGLEQEYKKLYAQFKVLSEEQRNSDFGKNMASQLKGISEKLNETKKSAGNWKDNIGQYTDSITAAFGKMGVSVGNLSSPLKGVTSAFKSFGAVLKSNPIGIVIAAIMALVTLFKKVREAVNKNEELQMRWNQAMSAFKPIGDAVANIMDKLAGVLVKVVEWISKAYEGVVKLTLGFTDFLGITKNAKEDFEEQQKLYRGLAKAQDDLTLAKRNARIESAKKSAEVERLREEASETENLKEKREKLEQAKKIQAEIDAVAVKNAKEELRILQAQAELTPNATADNEALANAMVAVSNAEAQAASNMRRFNRELKATKDSSSGAGVDNLKKKAQELYKELENNNRTEVQKLTVKYDEEKKLLEKYHLDTTLLTKKYNEDVAKANLETYKKTLENSRKFYSESLENEKRYFDNYVAYAEDQVDSLTIQIDRLSKDTTGRVGNLMTEFKNVVEKTAPELDMFFEEIYKNGDISKIVDYDYVINKVNYLKESNAEYADTLEYITNIGEEGWSKLTDGLSKAAESLNINDGLVIKTGKDYENILNVVIPNSIKKLQDQLVDAKIGEKMAEMRETILNEETGLLVGGFSEQFYNEEVLRNNYDYLNTLKEQLAEELTNFQGTQEQKLELMEKYYETVGQLRDAEFAAVKLDAERTQAVWDASFETFNSMASSINTVIGSVSNLIEQERQSGKITKEEAEKKKKVLKNLEKISLAVNLAQIAASTASAIMDVWKGFGAEYSGNAMTAASTGPGFAITKPVLDAKSLTAAILRTTAIAATGAANMAAATMGSIAKIKALDADSSSPSTASVGVAPSIIDSRPYEYYQERQFLQNEEMLNQQYFVSVTDIEDGLNHKVQVTQESSF